MAHMALALAPHLVLCPCSSPSSASSSSSSSSCSVKAGRPTLRSASAFRPSSVHVSSSTSLFGDGRELWATGRCGAVARRPGRLQVVSLFGLGVPELAVIAGVAAILFGPKKLPEIGKSLGKTVKSFQQAAKEFETEIKSSAGEVSAPASAAAPAAEVKPEAPAAPSTVDKETA